MSRPEMHKLVLLSIMILLAATALAETQTPPPKFSQSRFIEENSDITRHFEKVKNENMINHQINNSGSDKSTFEIGVDESNPPEVAGEKSVQQAFFMSIIIPGSGQLYTGSKIKALLFVGIEALSWYGYANYQDNGDDKTVEFEAFANQHWSRDYYGEFLETVPPDHHFTHTLPGTNTQQYFEMIGKYDQFVYGWDDATPLPRTYANLPFASSERRLVYEDMRHAANKEYSKSTNMIILAMVNHLVSGVEAAFAARRHNNRLESLADRLSFKARLVSLDNERVPFLTVSYKL